MARERVLTATLWLVVLLLIATWVRLPSGTMLPTAMAGQVASRGGFTLLSASSGDQRVPDQADAIYVLDHHRGMMLVYTIVDLGSSPQVEMLDGGRIEVLFERARGGGRESSDRSDQ
jgi:hypothetical protein